MKFGIANGPDALSGRAATNSPNETSPPAQSPLSQGKFPMTVFTMMLQIRTPAESVASTEKGPNAPSEREKLMVKLNSSPKKKN